MTHFTDIEIHQWRQSGPGADRERVVEHLAACSTCASRYAAAVRARPLRADEASDAAAFIAAGHRVIRRRGVDSRRWVLPLSAAVVLAFLVAVPAIRNRHTSMPELHFRGSGILAVAPQGAVDRDALEFVWSSGVAAPRFRIEVGDESGVIYAKESTESRLVMPPAARALLRPNVPYWWTVTALDVTGKPFASSARRTFRVRADS